MWPHEKSSGTLNQPIFTLCCGNGRVMLPDIEPVPSILDMLTGGTNAHSLCRQDIRKYNSSLAFTSHGAKLDRDLANQGRGVYTFRIQGSVYHSHGSLYPPEAVPPKFAQIYIYDDQDQHVRRNEVFDNELDLGTLQHFQREITLLNPFAHAYRHVRERLTDPANTNIENLCIVLRAERLSGLNRQYSLPSASEIAVLLPDQGQQPEVGRDIILQGRNGLVHRIDEMHWAYDPLHYVLMFPKGEKGWSPRTVRLRNVPVVTALDDSAANSEDIALLTRKWIKVRLGDSFLRGNFTVSVYKSDLLEIAISVCSIPSVDSSINT